MLRVVTEDGIVEVPNEVQAQGGKAIEEFVKKNPVKGKGRGKKPPKEE